MPGDPTVTSIITLLTVGGAAGAFYVILRWLIDGKLHTHSEVEGLQRDKADLLAVNKTQADALERSNSALERSNNLLEKALEGRRGS